MGLTLSEDGIYLKNGGLGLAIITDIIVKIDNKEYSFKSPNFRHQLISALNLQKDLLRVSTTGTDTITIAAQESVEFITPSKKPITKKEIRDLYSLLKNIKEIKIDYKTVYGKKRSWKTSETFIYFSDMYRNMEDS